MRPLQESNRGRKGQEMGELSRQDAEAKRNKYISLLETNKKYIREDFMEMDFENADQRDRVEEYIEQIEAKLGSLIQSLNDMTFE